MRSAKEEMDSGDNSTPMDSQQINMYLTRAQADELAKFFDQAWLMELLGAKNNAATDGTATAAQPEAEEYYREYGEQ